MSTIFIGGHLILDGNLSCSGGITIAGRVDVVPDENLKKKYYSPETDSYICSNGAGRTISSLTGDVLVYGIVDGCGRGFASNEGPGSNSAYNELYQNYGATHAGLGSPGLIASPPSPKGPYGNQETPMSLGSGSGYYRNPLLAFPFESRGGAAVLIVAPSGRILVDGSILMNGQSSAYAGGGAGGSIWLNGFAVEGSGTISSSGGGTTLTGAGGGGGGYVSIWYEHHYDFSGTLSVAGLNGGTDGKIYTRALDPVIVEKFTGQLWNVKWWERSGDTTQNNSIFLHTSPGSDSRYSSLFTVSGQNLNVACDSTAFPTDASHYIAYLRLWADERNWVSVERRYGEIRGVSNESGLQSSFKTSYAGDAPTLKLLKRDSTFAMQFYDASSLAPQTVYSDVFPLLNSCRFHVQMGLYQSNRSHIVQVSRLNPYDIASEATYLEDVPDSSVAMNIVTGTAQIEGDDYYVTDDRVRWDAAGSGVPLRDLLEDHDVVRFIYTVPIDTTDTRTGFDTLRIYEGIPDGAYSNSPVVYVDATYGSDNNAGTQTRPLQHLPIATAWALPGSTVVLYDGTHMPAEVIRKDLTIRGADGANAFVTSSIAQDTTGSGWETNCLSFRSCQGIVDNVKFGQAANGISVELSPYLEVRRGTFENLAEGIKAVNCDPTVLRSTFSDCTVAMDFSTSPTAYLYSNVVYDCGTAILCSDVTSVTVSSNTIDHCITGVDLSNSPAIVASNNITDCTTGIRGTSFFSYYNNFFGTTLPYDGTFADASGNISYDPRYVNPLNGDFHIGYQDSSDIGGGTGAFDQYWFDHDAVPRTRSMDIGALQYAADRTYAGDSYVAGTGDDYLNPGSKDQPFRTLDQGMKYPDATVHIDGGHYDSFYLELNAKHVDLNTLTVYTAQVHHFVSYYTLQPADLENGYVTLPGFVATPADASNVVLNVVGGGTQRYGVDYVVQFGYLIWKDYAIEPLLAPGDIFRVVYLGALQKKALNTLVLHSYYSNIDISRMVFVSPSGSDSTVMGGDGTNSGGNGSWDRPYRTVQTAMLYSDPGDNIVLRAGEYPVFDGVTDQLVVPIRDTTAVPFQEHSWQCIEDRFVPRDFRGFGATIPDEVPWSFTTAGRSSVLVDSGYMAFSYDGSNEPRSVSTFTLEGNWEAKSDLRNAIDPVFFMVSTPDSSAYFAYDGTAYRAMTRTAGIDQTCWGTIDVPPEVHDPFVVEYLSVTAENVRDGRMPLGALPDDQDCSSVSLNVLGGVPQSYGEDFIVQDGYVIWRDLALDGELEPGDVLRVIYKDRSVAGPVRVWMTYQNGRLTMYAYNGSTWSTVLRRDMHPDSTSWAVSYFMREPNVSVNHDHEAGRGFISKFFARADRITNTGLSKPYTVNTERRTVAFYSQPDILHSSENISSQVDGTRSTFYVPCPPVTRGDNGAAVTNDPSYLTVTVDGTSVTPSTLVGSYGRFTLAFVPAADSTVLCTYYTHGIA